jgi:hypothetical protein
VDADERGLDIPLAQRTQEAQLSGFGSVAIQPLVTAATRGNEPREVEHEQPDFTMRVMDIHSPLPGFTGANLRAALAQWMLQFKRVRDHGVNPVPRGLLFRDAINWLLVFHNFRRSKRQEDFN